MQYILHIEIGVKKAILPTHETLTERACLTVTVHMQDLTTTLLDSQSSAGRFSFNRSFNLAANCSEFTFIRRKGRGLQ